MHLVPSAVLTRARQIEGHSSEVRDAAEQLAQVKVPDLPGDAVTRALAAALNGFARAGGAHAEAAASTTAGIQQFVGSVEVADQLDTSSGMSSDTSSGMPSGVTESAAQSEGELR